MLAVLTECDQFRWLDFERVAGGAEVAAKILRTGERIYEVPISHAGREVEEGKKITWTDGIEALYVFGSGH